MTPVSDADKAAEELIRAQLGRARPRDAVLGEEYGSTGHGPRRWVVDPIDGTKNFVRGVPVWATLIALMDGDEVVVGLVSAPRSAAAGGRRRVPGRSPGGACRRPPGSRCPKVARVEDASFAYSSLGGWEDRGALDGMLDLTRAVWRRPRGTATSGPTCWSPKAPWTCARAEVNLWDLAALSVIVTEAGGKFTSLDGDRESPAEGNAAASNGRLHEDLLGITSTSAADRTRTHTGTTRTASRNETPSRTPAPTPRKPPESRNSR
ncbi:inositol monophosphatase family protein [Yinghuangia aomiensis]